MTKHLLILLMLILFCNAEHIYINDVKKIGSLNREASKVIHCGDYDGDGSEDICIVFEDFSQLSSKNEVQIDSFKVYSYKKKTELLNVATYRSYFSPQLITNIITSKDLDDDGDTEIIFKNYILDYLSDGVIKK